MNVETYITVMTLAVVLSLDAFSVAVCKGLAMKKITFGKAAVVGTWFGVFQAVMPLIGYYILTLLGRFFDIDAYDHWIAFALLVFLGVNMIREACSSKDEAEQTDSLKFGNMFMLALATSIDAMAAGVGFAADENITAKPYNIIIAVVLIGITTFLLSVVGVKFGNIFGSKYEKKAQIVGGAVLILLGIKSLLDAYGIIDLAFSKIKELINIII